MLHNDLFRPPLCVFGGAACDVTYEIYSSDVTFNVACELSEPMHKAENFNTAVTKNK